MVLGELNLTKDQIDQIKKDLERQIRERAGGSGPASLTNPIDIGVGTK